MKSLQEGGSGQKSVTILPDIPALVNIPVPANRFFWIALASATLAATSLLGSARQAPMSLPVSTGLIHRCMSILSITGPDSFDRYAALRAGVQVHLSPSP